MSSIMVPEGTTVELFDAQKNKKKIENVKWLDEKKQTMVCKEFSAISGDWSGKKVQKINVIRRPNNCKRLRRNL